ncbi:RidA family protein [Paenibacillus sacheonensis]|uniref:Uncharacterized protein n=1 Tax=Paenibacillus sacheonensis TaxID=742054 RepID=A0A7X5BZ70_9BACL|nr:RidA family protein [Paenibacillus sacheonensis]MBM7565044.1 enamine deaminase RidA (YjgF/YER057c/UK114 family) [Paenibacillus sacheonensis]NBC70171.1 hypothetical protein [Paenibacillus sacheonensis]
MFEQSIDDRLASLGILFPAASEPAAKYANYVNAADPDFEEHHKALNGCSDLMLDVFGKRGRHARSVLGAVSVRDNLPIIVDSIFEVEA